MLSGNTLILASLMLLLAVVAFAVKESVLRKMRTLPTSAHHFLLSPTELAYLLRDGDMAHTLIVMSVDLVQRAVKLGIEATTTSLSSYETQAWFSIKEFLTKLAEQKAGHLIPISDMRNPVKWVMRAHSIKRFVAESLRSFVMEVIKDPRHLRKYFSIAGIAQLSIQLYASSVRGAVERELKDQLLKQGLLVPEKRRLSYAQILAWMLPSTVIIVSLANYKLSAAPLSLLLLCLLYGTINGIVLKVTILLPSFLPTYEEFAKIAREIQRGGTRLALIRVILRLGKYVFWSLAALVCLILFALELAIAHLLLQSVLQAAVLIAAATVLAVVMVTIALDWHSLIFHEQASNRALTRIQEVQMELAHVSPLDSFRRLFGDESYDQTFSRLVAIYGVETLWLLS